MAAVLTDKGLVVGLIEEPKPEKPDESAAPKRTRKSKE